MPKRQIIAMGGGGFTTLGKDSPMDDYILSQSEKEVPVIGFVSTASGDSDWYITKFFQAFSHRPCKPVLIPLFKQPRDLAQIVSSCDIFYVGGGNTRNLIAVWQASGFSDMIKRAYEEGKVLAGVSAGAICWFEEGNTDSTGDLSVVQGLGILSGSCCPHFNSEEKRLPVFGQQLREGKIKPGLAIDEHAAVHIINEDSREVVATKSNNTAHEGTPSGFTPLAVTRML